MSNAPSTPTPATPKSGPSPARTFPFPGLVALAFLAELALGLATAGCDSDGHHAHDAGAIAAPTDLSATPVQGGVHLSWADRSDDEDGFMVMRKPGSAEWTELGLVAANTTSFHDTMVASGTTYHYFVHALRDQMASAPSNEVVITAP